MAPTRAQPRRSYNRSALPPVTLSSTAAYDFFALPQPTAAQWSRYLEFLFGQVRELLTNYGRVDIWFDGHWERMPAERWKAAELRALIQSLQPDILINGAHGESITGTSPGLNAWPGASFSAGLRRTGSAEGPRDRAAFRTTHSPQ